jgi:hypothetical protein
MTTIAIPPFKNNETLYFFERRIMTFTISNSTRSIVIQQYLHYSKISTVFKYADEHGLS